MKIIFSRFGLLIPLLWYPSKLASDIILDSTEWLRYTIKHSFSLELILMSVFMLIIEKLTVKKVLKTINNEKEVFSEEKNRLLKLDFLWWTIIFNVISGITGTYKLLKYIKDSYTKSEFGMLVLCLSVVILIFAARKKYLDYKKSKNIDLIQDELKRVYENNQIKMAKRYNKSKIVIRFISIISFASSMLLYYARLRAIENDTLLEYAIMYRQGAGFLFILFTIIPVIILIVFFVKNKRLIINFKREYLLTIKDKIYKYTAVNFILLIVSLFIFRYFFIYRELAYTYYFAYPIICFSVYYWRYKRYQNIQNKSTPKID